MSGAFAVRSNAMLGGGDEQPASEASSSANNPLLSILERLGYGALVLDASRNALQLNPTAHRLLERETGSVRQDSLDWARRALGRLLGRATTRLPANTEAWITVPSQSERSLVVHQMPAVGMGEPRAHTVLILLDLDGAPQPSLMMLRRMFGLTAAEAKLSVQIARGESPAEIAESNQVSMATVRSQLASAFAKTETRGQSELVALLARVSILS